MLQYFFVKCGILVNKKVIHMIKYGYKGLEIIKNIIHSNELKEIGRNNPNNFTRERKMGFTNLIDLSSNLKIVTKL